MITHLSVVVGECETGQATVVEIPPDWWGGRDSLTPGPGAQPKVRPETVTGKRASMKKGRSEGKKEEDVVPTDGPDTDGPYKFRRTIEIYGRCKCRWTV